MIYCSKRFEFDAAHRVMGHGGHCRHLHGHRYAVEVVASAPELDALGMVIDFGVIKEKVGGWIDRNLDHNVLLHLNDPLAKLYRSLPEAERDDPDGIFAGKHPFLMDRNPTAENVAAVICVNVAPMLPGVRVQWVKVWETPTSWAVFQNK